jgi:co-chaperonin GroES (HSP10)
MVNKVTATEGGKKVATKNATAHIAPLGDRVLIQPLDKAGESTTASGFILPGKEGSEKHERGIVVATGPGRYSAEGHRLQMEVTAGDYVWFKRGYDSEEVKVGGVDHILTSEANVLAIEK